MSRLQTCFPCICTWMNGCFFSVSCVHVFSFHFWLLWRTHIHTHAHRASGEDHSLVCLHRDREANWNVHCFLTRYCPQISSPPSSTGGRELYFMGDVHVGWMLNGLWEDGLVLVMSVCLPMAETKARLSLAQLYTVFFFSMPLIVPFHLTVSPSSLNVCCFSPSFCVQHIFVDLESRTVGKPRPSVKAKSTFVPDSLLTDFGFLDGQLSFGIFCKWLSFTRKGEFQLCKISIYMHPLLHLFF